MDIDFQYELYNEWVESKEKIALVEFCYKKGENDAIDEIKTYLFDMLCGKDNEGYIGKHCYNNGRCSETVCNWKLIETKLKQMKEGK